MLKTINVKNKYNTVYFHMFCHKKEQRNGVVTRRGISRETVFFFKYLFTYFAVSSLSCSMQDPQSSLEHANSYLWQEFI